MLDRSCGASCFRRLEVRLLSPRAALPTGAVVLAHGDNRHLACALPMHVLWDRHEVGASSAPHGRGKILAASGDVGERPWPGLGQ